MSDKPWRAIHSHFHQACACAHKPAPVPTAAEKERGLPSSGRLAQTQSWGLK